MLLSAFAGGLNLGAATARLTKRIGWHGRLAADGPRGVDIEPEPFSITRSTRGTTEVVALSGELDMANADAVAEVLDGLVDDGRRSIVVDLTDATFIDSTMLRVLLNVSKRLRPGGGELLVVCHEHNIRKIFEITLLDRVFTISETREEALEHLAAAGADPQV